jgi:hypothetical protein
MLRPSGEPTEDNDQFSRYIGCGRGDVVTVEYHRTTTVSWDEAAFVASLLPCWDMKPGPSRLG